MTDVHGPSGLVRRVPPLLRDRMFRVYWSAQSISMVGDQVTGIALPLVGVLTLHVSPGQMGLLTALVWAPNLVFALHAGALADRWGRRRRVMIAADLGRALLLLSVPAASALGLLTVAQLYAVAFAAGTLSVFFQVSDAALFLFVVDRGRYVEANSLVHGSRAASFMAGPSLGGILTQAVSAPFALLADAASFLGSAALLGAIAPSEPPPQAAEPGHLAAGIRFIRSCPRRSRGCTRFPTGRPGHPERAVRRSRYSAGVTGAIDVSTQAAILAKSSATQRGRHDPMTDSRSAHRSASCSSESVTCARTGASATK